MHENSPMGVNIWVKLVICKFISQGMSISLSVCYMPKGGAFIESRPTGPNAGNLECVERSTLLNPLEAECVDFDTSEDVTERRGR